MKKPALQSEIKPFLKWAGGKRWITPVLAKIIPSESVSYFEPFLGGASLFFATHPKRAYLGDMNQRLIETYIAVRDYPEAILQKVNSWPVNKKFYYTLRDTEYKEGVDRAAQFIFLNKTCWNGLYRVNKQGTFNVPYGKRIASNAFDESNFLQASQALKKAKIMAGDFQSLLSKAISGDFIYLDPPYTVLHSSNGFRQYNEKIFSWKDQIRLAENANKLANMGCFVVVSNSNHNDVVQLYKNFNYYELGRHSKLAGDPAFRLHTKEALFVSRNISAIPELQ